MEREDGGRQAARCGEERHAGAVAVDHAASAQRTRRRVVSGGGEIGRQATALGRGAARRCIAAAAVRAAWQRGRGGTDRGHGEFVREWMGKPLRFEKKVRAAIFYFYFRADGSVVCWVVRASRPTNMRSDETDALPTTLSIVYCFILYSR